MPLYLSAGHSLQDTGAIGCNGRQENLETIRLRNAIVKYLPPNIQLTTDEDTESLKEYLHRIHPGKDSVVVELHFDAAGGKASGSTAFYKNAATPACRAFAQSLVQSAASVLDIPCRGAKPESESNRKHLAILHTTPLAVLLEVCFIDNPQDMRQYDTHFKELAKALAEVCKVFYFHQ